MKSRVVWKLQAVFFCYDYFARKQSDLATESDDEIVRVYFIKCNSVFEWRLYMFQRNWVLISLVLPRSWTNLRKNLPYKSDKAICKANLIAQRCEWFIFSFHFGSWLKGSFFRILILFFLLRIRESGRFAILAFTFFSRREGGKEGVTTKLEVKQIVRRKFRNHP